MTVTRHRFLLYALIGLIFGIIDWFYLSWLAHVSWGSLGESILGQFFEWIIIAIIGGALMGAVAFWIRPKKLSLAT